MIRVCFLCGLGAGDGELGNPAIGTMIEGVGKTAASIIRIGCGGCYHTENMSRNSRNGISKCSGLCSTLTIERCQLHLHAIDASWKIVGRDNAASLSLVEGQTYPCAALSLLGISRLEVEAGDATVQLLPHDSGFRFQESGFQGLRV